MFAAVPFVYFLTTSHSLGTTESGLKAIAFASAMAPTHKKETANTSLRAGAAEL